MPTRVAILVLPQQVELETVFKEGEKVNVDFLLENVSHTHVVIKRFVASCGCTILRTKNEQVINVPFVLAHSEKYPFLATIDTTSMIGNRSATVIVQYEVKGNTFFSVAEIKFNVQQNAAK
jgi:hypothetical protein